MKANKKLRIGVIAVSIAAVTAVTVVTAAIYDVRRLNDNPWSIPCLQRMITAI